MPDLGIFMLDSEAYSEPCQISKTERFAKLVQGQKRLTILPDAPS